MKKSLLIAGLAVAAFASSCQQFKKGDGGLQYNIVKDAGNEKAVGGDLLSVGIRIITDRADSVFSDSYEIGLPQIINIAPDSIPGVYPGDYNSMFKMLGEGDSAVFRLDVDTMAAKTMQPKVPFADRYVTFEIKVNKHFKKGELTDSAFQAQIEEYYQGEISKLQGAETGKIEAYVKNNKLEATTTASGLRYVITEEGSGEKPVAGDTIRVNYTGSLTSGKIFDSSIESVAKSQAGLYNAMRPYEPIKFPVGQGQVIRGWDEGLMLLSKGSKAKFIIPSELAYGERGSGDATIPPYSPLVFEVEVVDIIKPTAPQQAEQN